MRRRQAAVVLLLMGGGLLPLVGGGNRPPLWDGLCSNPPYSLLHPSGGQQPAQAVTRTYTISNNQNPALLLADSDATPQVQLLIQQDGLVIPPGTTAVVASLTPVDPPVPAPAGRVVDGNAYRISVTTPQGTPILPRSDTPFSVVLNDPHPDSSSTVEIVDTGKNQWRALKTTPVNCAYNHAANSTTFGTYAVLNAVAGTGGSGGGGTSGGGGSGMAVLVAVAAVVVLLAVVIVAVRLSRRGQSPGR